MPFRRRSFGFAQGDRVGCQSDGDPSASLRMTGLGAIPAAPTLIRPHLTCNPDRHHSVIPTAVEGSQPVGSGICDLLGITGLDAMRREILRLRSG